MGLPGYDAWKLATPPEYREEPREPEYDPEEEADRADELLAALADVARTAAGANHYRAKFTGTRPFDPRPRIEAAHAAHPDMCSHCAEAADGLWGGDHSCSEDTPNAGCKCKEDHL